MNKSDCCNADIFYPEYGFTSPSEELVPYCTACKMKCKLPLKVNPLGVHIVKKMEKTTFKKPKVTKYYQVKAVRIGNRNEIYCLDKKSKNPEEVHTSFMEENPDMFITDIKLIEIITEDNPE